MRLPTDAPSSSVVDPDGLLTVRPRPLVGPDVPWSRRRLLATAGSLVAGGVLTACGGGAPSARGSTAGAATIASPTGDRAAGFPRVVEHAAGSTTLASKPERIVAATDGGELAALLALGIEPVGFGQRNDPLTPWIVEAGGADADIARYELAADTNFEVLAGWRPDVIVGQYGFVTAETIDAYARIAPTIATSFVGWRESLRQVAAAVGADGRAEEIIAELEGEIATTAARLSGTTLRTAWMFGFTDFVGQLNDRSPIGALLSEMGLPTLAAQVVDGEAADEIVPEQIATALDAVDAVVVLDFEDPAGDAQSVLAAHPLYANAEPLAAGRVVELGVAESNAAYFDSVLTVRSNLRLIERVLAELS